MSIGNLSPLSPDQIRKARPHCFSLLTHWMRRARALALARAGSNMAAKIAIIAITTSSSIKVNARILLLNFFIYFLVGCFFGKQSANSKDFALAVNPFLNFV